MNFSQALDVLKQGKKVARSIWGGYWYLRNIPEFNAPVIVAHLKDNKGECPATPYQEDILAEDWMVVE